MPQAEMTRSNLGPLVHLWLLMWLMSCHSDDLALTSAHMRTFLPASSARMSSICCNIGSIGWLCLKYADTAYMDICPPLLSGMNTSQTQKYSLLRCGMARAPRLGFATTIPAKVCLPCGLDRKTFAPWKPASLLRKV
uniref:Secreted protein n=1 Tax=Cacopsylla melanoneura TaxID=428564 RepID=A0A8D8XS20_9HEMI